MSDLNSTNFTGRFGRDPELKTTSSGIPVCNFSLAVGRKFKNAQGERETDWIDFVAWRKTAEFVAQYMRKGSRVAIEGSLQMREYQAQDGSKRKAAEIQVDNVIPLDSKQRQGGASGQTPPPDTSGENDDLPF